MSRPQQPSVLGKVNFSFRERALAEAARYGSDSWVFLRELLQNARDAGARRIELSATEEDGVESIACRDDGCGMSAVHAHRYLFALYASSKEGDARQAGQFGVGFWSVLRFKPDRVVIRSRPKDGDAWQVELSQRLENAVFTAWEMTEGTEIVLERHRPRFGDGGDGTRRGARPGRRRLADKVFDAAWRYGRFLTRREDGRDLVHHRQSPVHLTVNGRPVHARLELPAPSSSFCRRGFRGVVALGAEPRVELFANGLFVRQASCLEDLLEGTPNGDLEDDDSSLDLPGSVAPQILLDSSHLEPLLARSDVRQTQHLRKLVMTAEKELERLIERQLEAARPLPWFLPLWARLSGLWNRLAGSRRLRMTWWLAPMAAAGILAGWLLAGWTVEYPAPARRHSGEAGPLVWWDVRGVDLGFGQAAGGFVGDLGARYLGPRPDPLMSPGVAPPLSYEPADSDLFLAALLIENPETWTSRSGRAPEARGAYEGANCPASGRGCVSVRLKARSDLRLPVATGHRVDPDSVRRNGRPQKLLATAAGEPLVVGIEEDDLIEYRTAPGAEPAPQRLDPASSPPPRLRAIAAELAALPPDERVDEAVERVRQLVAYDRSAETVHRHWEATRAGVGFAEASLEVGKGDCDVQNGLLVMLLRETGIAARLAVGYVGQNGRAVPGLHAWAEYLGEDRYWRTADVSAGIGVAEPPRLLWVASPGSPSEQRNLAPIPVLGTPQRSEPGGSAILGAVISRVADHPGFRRFGSSLLVGAAVVFSVALLMRRRDVRPASMRLTEPDIAALLGGALQHPGLARLPALAHGRFIPLIGPSKSAAPAKRRAISLNEARRRAADGRLFSSAAGSHLARVAAARGIPVIDASQAEGRVAGLGLGAVDLDEWSDLIDRGTGSGLVAHLNDYLVSVGVDWRVALATPLSRPLKVVDLSLLGLGRRQVLIDPRSADFAAAGPRLDLRSDTAAFRLLDAVIDHLDLARYDRAQLLAELARRAVVEKYGR